MLLELGIVFAGYAVVRFFEKKREPEKENTDGDTNIEKANLSLIEAEEAEKKEHKHYLKMSAVATGIGAVRQFLFTSPPFALLNIAAFTYIAVPHFKSAENSLLNERKVDGYVLYFLADTTTFLLGQYFAAALGVSLFHLSKLVVSRARGHSKKKLLDIFEQQQPRNAWLLKDGIEIEVPISTIRNGDIIVIKSGDIIPVDGIITDGMASIDEHALTGESRPLEKVAGDEVFAATVVITGRICIRIEKSGKETTIAKINQILNRSADIKTNFQLKGEKWADKGVLPMLIIAGLGLPVLGPVGFVIILSSHVCTKIRVVAPLSTLNYISIATHNGVMIKDGRALERLSKVDVVLFDKTGTLTYQDNEVVRIIATGLYQEDEILTYAAAAERYVAHPIAKAILRKAKEARCTIPLVTDESEYQIGYGITVNLEAEDKVICVGSSRFMLSEGIGIPDEIKAAEKRAHLEGHSFVIVAVNRQVNGAIELQTMLRPEVRDVLKQLRQTGVKHLAIVSGDHELPTRKLAESLGMDTAITITLRPNTKLIWSKNYRNQGKQSVLSVMVSMMRLQ